MLADITLHSLSLWLHVSAAVVGLGATFALAVGFPLALKLDARYLPFVHHLSSSINRKLAGPALLILLITGIYQAADGDISLGEPWISGTFVIVIVLGGAAGRLLHPDRPQARRDGGEGARRRRDDAVGRLPAPGAARGRDRRARRPADRRSPSS